MKFKDYYQTLGVPREATPDEIKHAYRKLARKYHPDVSKERDAEARFKEISEAGEVLRDTEKRTAYDAAGSQWERQQAAGQAQGGEQDFQPPPGWDAGFEFSGRGGADGDVPGGRDHSDFFEALFGRAARADQARRPAAMHMAGQDHHAKVLIDLEDAYRGARRSITLRMPARDDQGHGVLHERTLDVTVPKGVREGQHLRLAGQGGPGLGEAAAGDLYLEVAFNPHRLYRVDGRDVYLDLPVTPWEAALGAVVSAPTPDGHVELTVPPASVSGRRLRLKGKGIPGKQAGDFYVVLTIALPPADSAAARGTYEAFAAGFDFNPRAALQG